MKRGFLHWVYLMVQFVMLAMSIPKVATLFHAYDRETIGPLIGGVDIRSWAVGLAIDLCAAITTWAAMNKYEESRKRRDLLAPAVIIFACTMLSIVANYEDAATLLPEQYRNVSLFTHPALLINPILISSPPLLVLLLILIVPQVLARPRLKTAEEIAATADEQEALIAAQGRIKAARARANAQVRDVRLAGVADTASALAKRAGISRDEPEPEQEPFSRPHDIRYPQAEPAESAVPATANTRVSKAMWNTMSLKERVIKSGLISTQEVAETLGLSRTRARELVGEVKTEDMPSVPGRTGVPYQALIDALYAKRRDDSFAQAQKLEKALSLRKRTRQLHVVPSEDSSMPSEGSTASQGASGTTAPTQAEELEALESEA